MRWLILILGLLSHSMNLAQSTTTLDTLSFVNRGHKIEVIHTTIRHCYYDSTCIWEIVYPQIGSMKHIEAERSANLFFREQAGISDCVEDKQDNEINGREPSLQHYWLKIEIICIRNGIISYRRSEGNRPLETKEDCEDITYHFYDLEHIDDFNTKLFFKSSEAINLDLDELINTKRGFQPRNQDNFRNSRQYYFNCKDLIIYYAKNALKGDHSYHISLTLNELKDLILSGGPLDRYFKDQDVVLE